MMLWKLIVSMLSCVAGQVLYDTPPLVHTCSVNITQGVSFWQSNAGQPNARNYSYFDVSVNSSVVTSPPWKLQFEGSGAISAAWNWDIFSGRVDNYWDSLTTGTRIPVGFIASNIAPENGSSAEITQVRIVDNKGHPAVCTVQQGVEVIAGDVQSGTQPVSVVGGKLHGVDGQPLALKGINYFGFETSGGSMVDGLWEAGSSITGDFATVVYRLKLLGFNAVRLPFSFKNLYGGTPTSFTQACPTDSVSSVASSTSDPAVGFQGAPPEPTYTPPSTPGVCNSYLPNDSVLNRFMFVLDVFAKNGMYMIIDNHLNLDTTITDDPDKWVQQWKSLATTISQSTDISPWVLMDLANEPDSLSLRWEGANGLPSMTKYYLAAMDAISSVIPNQVMLVEGLGQQSSPQAICWYVPRCQNVALIMFCQDVQMMVKLDGET